MLFDMNLSTSHLEMTAKVANHSNRLCQLEPHLKIEPPIRQMVFLCLEPISSGDNAGPSAHSPTVAAVRNKVTEDVEKSVIGVAVCLSRGVRSLHLLI